MSAQAAAAGRNYETSLRNKLKAVYSNIPTTAGFGSGPDITIPSVNNPGQRLLIEAKTTTGADFGQKAVTFNGVSWVPSTKRDEVPEISALYNYLFNTYDVGGLIANAWKLPNKNITAEDLRLAVNNKQLSKVLYYEKMLQKASGKPNPFPTKTLVQGPKIVDSIKSYYNSKGIYYIQVKGSGFYILGNDVKNLRGILGINIPFFEPTTAELIIRGKTSISGRTYSPTLTFKSASLAASQYSLDRGDLINLLHSKL
jgi:hypothetical protein